MRIFNPQTGKPVVAYDTDGTLIAGGAAFAWIVRTGEAEDVHVIRGLSKGTTHEDVVRLLREVSCGEDGEAESEHGPPLR